VAIPVALFLHFMEVTMSIVESQVEDASSAQYQLGVMRNVEENMSKAKRSKTYNWVLVQRYLLSHTSKGGSTSSYIHCQFLGVDPDGYTFR
jgi:hypothetical protein